MSAKTDTDGGRSLRQTIGFLEWVFATGDPDEATLETTGLPTSQVGDRTVVFS